MDASTALDWMTRLLGLVAIVQGFEFLQMAPMTADSGVWRWRDLEPDLGKIFRPFLNSKSFYILNVARILIGMATVFYPTATGIVILLVLHSLTLFRWLGTVNG